MLEAAGKDQAEAEAEIEAPDATTEEE